MVYSVVKFIALFIFIFGIVFSGCKSKYHRILERELASGVRHDSLFLGLTLGMDRKTFYALCWDLNKSGKMTQGPNNLSARYSLFQGLKAPAYLDFYPTFNNDTICEMPTIFTYKDWSPWNKSMSPDSLLVDVRQLLEKWYGAEFFEIKSEERGNMWVKIDGNRRIKLFKTEPKEVQMVITDMTNPPKPIQ